MSELKEGMYVRTKNKTGWCCIGKIYNINDYREPSMKYCIDIQGDDFVFIGEDMIVKASCNTADVLVAGDIAYMSAYGIPVLKPISESDILEIKFGNFRVIQVITKEQFDGMSYKVGE